MTTTLASLKKKYRTMVEKEDAQISFSRKQDLITCLETDVYKSEIFKFIFTKEQENMTFECEQGTGKMNFTLFTYITEYLVEFAKLEGYKKVAFNHEKLVKSLNFQGQTKVLRALLEAIGFEAKEKFYVYSTEKPFQFVSGFIQNIRNIFEMFSEKNPSFYFELSPPSHEFNSRDFTNVFFSCLINWQGYQGIIGFKKTEEGFRIEQITNTLQNIQIEIPRISFTEESVKDELFSFLNHIPEQMMLPNVLKTPTAQLQRLINKKLGPSNSIPVESVMQELEEFGYNFLEIEDEAARILKSPEYSKEKEIRMPSYPLAMKKSIRDSILRIHNHCLILMGTGGFPKKSIYGIVEPEEQIEPTVKGLAKQLEELIDSHSEDSD